ncbi:MAG: ImmA/IrrE family metallo-endopeptidase [Spirochaetaceae bacterium]|jgi:Zn-dependent peptidase ImmA (M78 family)|nr:ImmA/IrrE family metallo-endopeptidase [Spirochaetaceae bacterium]
MCRLSGRAVFNFFPFFKSFIDENLLEDGDGFTEAPWVDIEDVARKNDIFDIKYILPEEFPEKYKNAHAYLEDSIIYVNKNDNKEKQRFSIAHEIFHYKIELVNEDGNTLKAVARRGNAWKEQNADTDEAVGEDIADYFAANLLVPSERFILWEDKPNEEIAHAFGVELKCIERRREEIEYERHQMEPKNLSSDVKIAEQPRLTPDEFNQILEGHSTRALGRA